ncbi:MAG: serine/threonine-protein kinase [Gemmatimonadaceae bacterium]|nr:serine/threonine-protein kinase [Gemmatimonadaceae bacterium]
MTLPGSPADSLFVTFQLALAGRYSIDRELGRGGMGVVYLAREVHLDRPVAIKLLPPERAADPALRDRFLREARLAAKLSHPNIIPIYAVDESTGFVFYAMAYVDGETLAERVRLRGPVSSSEAARIMRDAAWALAHAHSQGLVHRDVKPDNILLESGTGRVLVADFGIAAVSADATGEGISGTPEFMSPEQALGQELDGRSDLYGLGVTAFYALTGRLPFEGRTPTEVLAKQVTEPAAPLLSMGAPVSRKIAAIVDRCLAKSRDQRPASAEAVAAQLGVAIEQRRELPVALRVFAKDGARLNGGGTIIFPFALLGVTVGVSSLFGTAAAYGTLAALGVLSPLAYLVHAAGRLLRQGFAQADVAPAFQAEIEQAREERAAQYGRSLAKFETPLRQLALTSGLGLAGTTIWILGSAFGPRILGPITIPGWGISLFAFCAGSAFLSTLGYLTAVQQRDDVDGNFWKRVWTGRIGRVVFAMARRLVGRRKASAVMTHRATELALGLAAENLFETLPKETRLALGDLPKVLDRLQHDAQLLRAQYNELQEALSEAPDGGASEAYADVRATRDAIHDKLTDTVGALETIRLNLLRLHAGSATVDGLTTHLNIAAEVSREVERLLAAREELEHHLEFPREIATTPA